MSLAGARAHSSWLLSPGFFFWAPRTPGANEAVASLIYCRDDEDTPQKQHISSAHQDQGPIDVSELGSWAYTLSSTSSVDDTSVDEGFGQTQASAEHEAGGSEPGQPARLQNVISTASETSASGLRVCSHS